MTQKKPRRQRGEGSLHQRADGMWIGMLDLGYGADGKRKRPTVSSRDYAEAFRKLQDLKAKVAANGADIPTGSTTVEKWLTRWVEEIAAPRVRPKTLEHYRSDIRLHIAPAVGRHRLDRLAPQHVRAMGPAIIAKGNSSTTAHRCHRVLAVALTDAMREGLVVRNVASLVPAPKKAAITRSALTAAQGITLLRSVADDPLMGSRWAAALFTGARRGELLGLQRDRVSDVLDLSWQLQRLPHRHGCGQQQGDKGWPCGRTRAGSCPARALEVPAGFEYRVLDGPLALTRPKSHKGTRIIPLVEPLRSILERRMQGTDPGPHNLVWARPDGRPIDPRDDSKAWNDALDAAGLPRVPLHAARHTAATLLLEAGVPETTIQEVLGHSDVVTSQGYIHVDQTLKRLAMEALSGRLALDAG